MQGHQELLDLTGTLAGIVAAAVHVGLISALEGICDIIDCSCFSNRSPAEGPSRLDHLSESTARWARRIAEQYLDPAMPGVCSDLDCTWKCLLMPGSPLMTCQTAHSVPRHAFAVQAKLTSCSADVPRLLCHFMILLQHSARALLSSQKPGYWRCASLQADGIAQISG